MENEIIKLLFVFIFKSRRKRIIDPYVREPLTEFDHRHLANYILKKKEIYIYFIAILNNVSQVFVTKSP